MKKTLIALALTAIAASGSAMAWTANGTGGTVEFGGTLSPEKETTPWEVKVGEVVNDLNASVKKDATSVDIALTKPILVLGIRAQSSEGFHGGPGINPQIDYGNKIDFTKTANSEAPLTLDVMDSANTTKLGTLTAPVFVSAMSSWVGGGGGFHSLLAKKSGDAFFGGLYDNPAQEGSINPLAVINSIDSSITENFSVSGKTEYGISTENFNSNEERFNGFYGAGIQSGKTISIKLDNPVAGDIQWKASLPVTVSYQ